MTNHYTSICVYGGSSASADPIFLDAARQIGELLAEQGITLVYGAGRTGMMGAVAAGAISKQGKVVGVTHKFEEAHARHMEGLTRLEVMETLQQRRLRMAELADAFITMPGGYGTMNEFFEVVTWDQIGISRKPVALLNLKGYYDQLLAWLEHAVDEKYLCREHIDLLIVERDPDVLLKRLKDYQFPENIGNWFEK